MAVEVDKILRALLTSGVDPVERKKCNKSVKRTLRKLAEEQGFRQYDNAPGNDGEWMDMDVVWWENEKSSQPGSQKAVLVAECELDPRRANIVADFQKLPSFKAPWKLMVFRCDERELKAHETVEQFEKYLEAFSQHVEGEHYVAVALGCGNSASHCYEFTVRRVQDGKVEPGTVRFQQ